MMKRLKICCFLGLALLLLTLPVRSAELPPEVERALPREAGQLLKDVDHWDVNSFPEGLCAIWNHLRKDVNTVLRRQTRGAVSVLLVAVLCGLVSGFQKGVGDESRFLPMAGGLAVTALTAGSLDSLMGAGTAVMEQMNTFSKALLPTLAAVSAISGGAVGATLRQIATVFFADLLLGLIHGLLMPMVYLYAGALAAGCCLADKRLTAVAELLKTVCTKLLTAALLAFTLYLTVGGIFAGTVDSARVRVTKTAISGMIPVVGGIIAEASETVLAGAGLLKGAIGVFGLLGVLALCAYPFLQLGIQYLLYKLTAFLASVIGDTELCGLIGGLGGGTDGCADGLDRADADIVALGVITVVAAPPVFWNWHRSFLLLGFVIARQVDHGDLRGLRGEFVIAPVFVVLVGYAVEPGNISMLSLGGLHALPRLLLGQAVKGEALAVGKLSHKAERRENLLCVVHGVPPVLLHYNTK